MQHRSAEIKCFKNYERCNDEENTLFKILWATIESNFDKEDALVAAFIWECVILFIETSSS